MANILYQIIWFLLVFAVMFTIYYIMLRKKVKKKKSQVIGEFSYLIHRFKLDTKKINYSSMAFWVSFLNALIVSFVSTFIMLIPLGMVWRLLIAFVLLFALIYALYEIYGRHLKRKYQKD